MANQNNDDLAREAGVAVPATSKEKYLAAVAENSLNLVSSDAGDPSIGWSASRGVSYPELADVPGQVYTPEQLPDPAQAIAAGLPPQQIPEHLIVEDVNHPQGPEPSELVMLDVRKPIREAVVADRVERAKFIEDAQAANLEGGDVEAATAPNATSAPLVATDGGSASGAKAADHKAAADKK